MKVKQILILLVALILAGGSFFLMRQNNAKQQPVAGIPQIAPKANVETTKILVTNASYKVGDRIAPQTLIWQDWPTTSNIEGSISQQNNPKAAETLVGSVVATPMFAGEAVLTSKLIAADEKDSVLSALLTPGMRATAVSISPETSVAGFILPNSKVDVILTRAMQIPVNGQTITKTVSSIIFENVRVLAIDQNTAPTKDQKTLTGATATVELSPQDAEKLKAAESLGKISLTLRSLADNVGPTVSKVDSAAMNQPIPQPVKEAVVSSSPVRTAAAPTNPATANPVANIKIYRGGQ